MKNNISAMPIDKRRAKIVTVGKYLSSRRDCRHFTLVSVLEVQRSLSRRLRTKKTCMVRCEEVAE